MMTRKDYVATADILDVLVSTAGENLPDVLDAVDAFAEMFAKDNPRFDRTRFVNACGVFETTPQGDRWGQGEPVTTANKLIPNCV